MAVCEENGDTGLVPETAGVMVCIVLLDIQHCKVLVSAMAKLWTFFSNIDCGYVAMTSHIVCQINNVLLQILSYQEKQALRKSAAWQG